MKAGAEMHQLLGQHQSLAPNWVSSVSLRGLTCGVRPPLIRKVMLPLLHGGAA